MEKIVITTTSFGKYDRRPLNLLCMERFEVISNPYGRKLNKDEVIELSKDTVGIIAGTEILDVDTLECLTKTYPQTSVFKSNLQLRGWN